MEIKIKADAIMGRVSKTDKIDPKSYKEYVAINEATEKMYNQAETLMPIIMNGETVPADYTFEDEVLSAVNEAGYLIVKDIRETRLFLTVLREWR